jgi:hypothetical protein
VSPLRHKAACVLAVAAAAAIAGCGGGGGTVASQPAARPADFPAAGATSTPAQISALPRGPIFAPSVSVFRAGSNRVGFGLFTADRKQIDNAEAALYTADPTGRLLGGPYPAHLESLAVAPQFQSETVAKDPLAAKGVYVADVPLPKAGKYVIFALTRLGGKLQQAGATEAVAGAPGAPPDVGQAAIAVHTPTVAQVGRNLASIDTRVPPAPDLQQVDFASVLRHKPVVLLFATPALCQSRVCGPVVDVEEQIKSQTGNRVAFIHMEIYNNNDVSKGYRPQVGAYRLPSEPWLFAIDRNGRIAARLEGAFSVAELKAVVAKLS